MENKQERRQITFNETFQSSLNLSDKQKFIIDKSLIQGIKSNDVSKIIYVGENLDKSNDQQYNQTQKASSYTFQTHQKFNQMKTKSQQAKANIDKMTSVIDFYKMEQNKYQNLFQQQKQSLATVQRQLQSVTTLMNQKLYRRDTYLYMLENAKANLLILKKRYFDKNIIANKDHIKLKSIHKEAFNKKKLDLSCEKMFKIVDKTVLDKHYERDQKINSVQSVLDKIKFNHRRVSQRNNEVKDIIQAAMTDKNQQEREWIKIFHTNSFLKKILKCKMERLMGKYELIQKCFQRIKLETNITYVQDFVIRFLNRQKNYGKLLQSISEKQAKLNKIKIQKQQLQKINENQKYQSDELSQAHKKHNCIPVQYQKTLDLMNNKVLNIERIKQVSYSHSIKGLVNLLGLKRSGSTYKKYPKTSIKEVIRDYLLQIKDILVSIQKQADSNKKIQQAYLKSGMKEATMTQEMKQKNVRVKTVQNYEDEGVDIDFEDKDMDYDNISEIDYLNHYRRLIKKNDIQNRRFRIKTKPF